jgi:hypothetical protein
MFLEGDGTWILGSQLNWFRMFPQQESHLPTAGLHHCPIIWTKSGVQKEEESFKEEERFLKEA